MYSKITIFCDNEAELREFAERILSKPTVAFPEPVSPQAVIQTPVMLDPVEKPARKPRADAGKPRGPYKTTTTGEPAETVQQDGTDKAAALAPAKSELPATPTTSAAPEKAPAEGDKPQPSGVVPATAAAEPTLDDARAALARINAVPGLGMEACLAHLAEFGTDRITLLKKEHYARFITAADAKVAAAKAKK
jgi:hypothetical protein